MENKNEITTFPRELPFMLNIQSARGSGKTTLLLNIMLLPYEQGGYGGVFDEIYLISPNIYADKKLSFLASKLNPENVFDEYDPESINFILDNNYNNNSSQILIILDDCMSEAGFKSDTNTNPITRVATIGRNRKISMIILTQTWKALPRKVRDNLECWIGFNGFSEPELLELFDELNPPFFRSKTWIKNYILNTSEKYSFIIFDKRKQNLIAYTPSTKKYKLIANTQTKYNEANNEFGN